MIVIALSYHCSTSAACVAGGAWWGAQSKRSCDAQEPKEYADWIQRDESWGGAIELQIFSKHYRSIISCVDVQTNRVDHYGESGCAAGGRRGMLIYDGIHCESRPPLPCDQARLLVFAIASSLCVHRSDDPLAHPTATASGDSVSLFDVDNAEVSQSEPR